MNSIRYLRIFRHMMYEEKAPGKILDFRQALAKAESYCAYQERSQQEVRDKLYGFGLHAQEVEQLIAVLIENNFLNEERFAYAYVNGKFRMKGWGKYKIKQGLKLKRVPEKLIQKALNSIDPEAYLDALEQLLVKKSRILGERDEKKRQLKLMQYALAKGFEKDLIFDVLSDNKLKED